MYYLNIVCEVSFTPIISNFISISMNQSCVQKAILISRCKDVLTLMCTIKTKIRLPSMYILAPSVYSPIVSINGGKNTLKCLQLSYFQAHH